MVNMNYPKKMAVSKLAQRWHIPAAFLLLTIVFIWSLKSTTIHSNPLINSGFRVSVVKASTKVVNSISTTTTLLPSTNHTNLSLNFTHKSPVSPPDSPSLTVNVNLESSFFDPPVSEMYKKDSEVEGQMAVLRSYIAKSRPSSDCDGRGIYVYDLPAKFNKDLLAECSEMASWLDYCKFLSNDAMGEPLPELGEGWYNTHQYTLEPIFHTRILNHPCRVQNVDDAKLFYVPFYGGHDAILWYLRNVTNDVKDALSNEIVEWLELQKPWKRNSGLDHVFVLGKISWDFRRPVDRFSGSRLLELDELYNPIKLLIERQPRHINDVGVPHPTHFHPSSDEDIMAWQAKLKGIHREYLISFAGASRKGSRSIRSTLIEQCKAAPDNCKFFDCRRYACLSPVPVIKLFTESEFCLQPIGDSPTRKSVFDSLVAGCIPVVFDPLTAYYQYPWHLPEDHTKYSVYIDQNSVKSSEVNVVEILAKIPSKRRQEMRRYIIEELMPRLVYSDPKAKLEKFEDAFSIAVNNLLESVASRLPVN